MESKPGTYALILRSRLSTNIQIGRRGMLELQPGYYVYVGSAFGPGGVLSRVSRHCRADKVKRWHIDYLREHTTPVSCWYCLHHEHLEHQWAEAIAGVKELVTIEGFGCSDCRCRSHLFYTESPPELDSFLKQINPSTQPTLCEVFTS